MVINALYCAIQAHVLHVLRWFVTIVIAAIQLQQHVAVSRKNGHAVSLVDNNSTAINIHVLNLVTTETVPLAIRPVFNYVNADVIKRPVIVLALHGSATKNVANPSTVGIMSVMKSVTMLVNVHLVS